VLLFDGDCGFCRLWVGRWRGLTADAVEYLAYQDAAARFPKLDRAELARAVHLVEPDGAVHRGADAVFRAAARARGWGWLPRLYAALPPFAAASEAAYAFVAARRPLFSALTRGLWGAHLTPPPVAGTARVFLALLGLCYLAAFASLGVQLPGLIGSEGLLPAAGLLQAAGERLGPSRYWLLPSLAWLGASDGALLALCAAGGLASLALVAGVFAGPAALACWALYLSLSAVGSDFLSFQWDALLLETGLAALFVAPWGRRARAQPSRAALLLPRLLLAKLMLQSGVVKLASGDAAWSGLTALTYHYWTQPIPVPFAWTFHHLPLWFHKASCLGMFAVELAAPVLLFAPRRPRLGAVAAIAALQLLIVATGNYGFFNLLTLALCAAALDDAAGLDWFAPKGADAPPGRARLPAAAAFAALWLAVSLVESAPLLGASLPRSFYSLPGALAPLRSINRYGLFAVMTTERNEIVVEVSVDGKEWREQPFKHKPQDPAKAPPLLGAHMPRLDWQMWFAALGGPQQSPWFGNLLFRLLSGSPAVEKLLGPRPFPEKPAYARAAFYSFRFSTPEEKKADGSWWKRERKGLYYPVVSLGP
jgi:lipase maturation factor 1